MYERARSKDIQESTSFYKLVKYVKSNVTEDGKPKEDSNLIVRDFLNKYQVDLIEIPEEFENVEPEPTYAVTSRKAKSSKKKILTRSDKSL